ncbi:beta and beta-prime subunits of DNA dependent RNA-polymerase [Neoconidiobolus thromboides FSU 785]|nr:beta and beta-prime subunits of DNA dependent RNA-polymerase [Neoconidiobolus thromboides FSU 785]
MNISQPISSEVAGVNFSIYTPEEIRKISVKPIYDPKTFDIYNNPNKGGLYDPALGACDTADICGTCSLDKSACPGHFGHIELPVPVINALFYEQVLRLLASKCFFCHKLRFSNKNRIIFMAKFKLLQAGLIAQAENLDPSMIPNTTSGTNIEDPGKKAMAIFNNIKNAYLKSEKTDKLPGFQKSTNTNNLHSEFIREILKSSSSCNVCKTCGGVAVKVSHDSYHKIFQAPLSKKKLAKMQMLNISIGDVFKQSSLSTQKKEFEADVEIVKEAAEIYSQTKVTNGQLDNLEQVQNGDTIEEEEEEEPKINGKGGKEGLTLLTPLHVLHHIHLLFEKEKEICSILFGDITGRTKLDSRMFLLEVVSVPPSRFRPAAMMNGSIMENPQTANLAKILNACQSVKEASNQKDRLDLLIDSWIQLQKDVNALIDSSRGNNNYNKDPLPGIKQVLEKKEGLFRKHMMGKRVNYAARSVISPDPNIETNEIGIPPVFATTLTYPEPVTHYNVKKLRDAVIKGPKVWPGATHVQHEDGTLTQLEALSTESRIALANQLLTPQDSMATSLQSGSAFAPQVQGINKKVYRHIGNGDIVLLNRQPTLHKPSIMAHKVRVLPGEKTIRMHYANCNTYNADFDGDEMNIHFPQSEVARSEAYMIANTDNQYLVPTNGAPLRGLIQDHVATGVLMTCKDTFFTREEYMQLIYGSFRPEDDLEDDQRIITVPPAVFKPRPLWTGKQIITTIMANLTRKFEPINLESKCRVPARYWDKSAPEEGKVIFVQGEYITGCLDKNQFGASSYGLVHAVYELYGAITAGKLLSILGRLFTKYCQHRGFTCRMDDLGLTPIGDKWRRDIISESTGAGQEATIGYIGLKGQEKFKNFQNDFLDRMQEVYHNDEKLQGLDATMKNKMNGITSSIIQSCIPDGLYRKFPQNHMQVMTVSGAKGSNVNVSQISCLLGQQELEGRRVPLMASGKTLPSFQPYETSARAGGFIAGRFLTGIKPQEYFFHCMAGREGLIDTAVKTSRSGYIQRCLIKHLEGLRVHYDYTVRDFDGSLLQFYYGEDGLDVTKQKYINKFEFSAKNYSAIKNRYPINQTAFNHIDGSDAINYSKKVAKKPYKYDPTMALYSPSKYLGSVSEKFYGALNKFTSDPSNEHLWKESAGDSNAVTKRKFKTLMNLKFMRSLADPGEAVGLLAAQSVGEPSTQMTLNTFHFAGFGAKNVTLGIPRLREIVMVASKEIKTPSMTLSIKPEVTDQEKEDFCKQITKLRLSELTDEIEVVESLATVENTLTKQYVIKLKLFSPEEYTPEFSVTPRLVERSMIFFAKRLEHLLVLELRRKGIRISMLNPGEKKGEDDEDDGEGIDDKPSTKKKADTGDLSDGDDAEESDGDDDAKKSEKSKQKGVYENEDEKDDELEAINKEFADGGEELDEKEVEETIKKSINDTISVYDNIIKKAKFITDFKFDNEGGNYAEFCLNFPVKTKKILMVGIAEKACKQAIVRQVKNIERAFPIENEAANDMRRLIATEGLNIQDIWKYSDIIDVNNIETNDCYNMLITYGVEACRNSIKREIASVFGVYGIEVDQRHLALIADYMTYEGGYRAFNRMSIKTCPSPLQQMSFETTVSFLAKAVLHNDHDTLMSPSSRIVLGKVVEGGTGAFGIYQPITLNSKVH